MLGVPKGINPDIPGQYLLQVLWDVGPSRFDGGEYPILWTELVAYAGVSDVLSEPWELRAVMSMSKAYVAEKNSGKDPLRMAPVDRDGENG